MTSLPSRLKGIIPALRSIAAQSRRPEGLLLSLPRRSTREGTEYLLPDELKQLLTEHRWMEVNWVERDDGPGTKLLGALHWLRGHSTWARDGDVLMVLDDDHVYLPFALQELLDEHQSAQKQSGRGSVVCSFFAYFCRGIMVPQGADIVAFPLGSGFEAKLTEYYARFVKGDEACFIVDDLWVAMFLHLCGWQVVSLRDRIVARGLEMVYSRTENARVAALMDLGGDSRRDRATVRAFDGVLRRLLAAPDELAAYGGAEAVARLRRLDAQVSHAERRIRELGAWLEREGGGSGYAQKAAAELQQLRHLYQLQAPLATAASP